MSNPKRWTNLQIPDQRGRVVIVTGANSGIGFETAKSLAGRGAHTILACRNPARAEEAVDRIRGSLPEARIDAVSLDLADLRSVRTFAAEVRASCDRLDLLINNAGVMMPPQRLKTNDGFELQFGVNHLGHFALTSELSELLRTTPDSRVVNVSSMAHRWGSIDLDDPNWQSRRYDKQAAYGQSKLANLLFTLELQRRFHADEASTIAVAAHPGWTATNLQRDTPMFRALNPLLAMRPPQGALPTLYAATAPEVEAGGYYGPGGWMEMRGYPAPAAKGPAARDAAVACELWAISEALVAAA
jgi:NAD(P)-dependent dehydrogenase (short-subunit alcohol dehydrogenase family)